MTSNIRKYSTRDAPPNYDYAIRDNKLEDITNIIRKDSFSKPNTDKPLPEIKSRHKETIYIVRKVPKKSRDIPTELKYGLIVLIAMSYSAIARDVLIISALFGVLVYLSVKYYKNRDKIKKQKKELERVKILKSIIRYSTSFIHKIAGF